MKCASIGLMRADGLNAFQLKWVCCCFKMLSSAELEAFRANRE